MEDPQHSPAFCLQLLDELFESKNNHHCSLCLFFHGEEAEAVNGLVPNCDHAATLAQYRQSLMTPFSDCSFYTAQTSSSSSNSSVHSHSSDSSGDSSQTVKVARTVATSSSAPELLRRQPALRRRSSPTHQNLRDLHHEHALQEALRMKRSEEQLQRIYEAQIWNYLDSDSTFTNLGTIAE